MLGGLELRRQFKLLRTTGSPWRFKMTWRWLQYIISFQHLNVVIELVLVIKSRIRISFTFLRNLILTNIVNRSIFGGQYRFSSLLAKQLYILHWFSLLKLAWKPWERFWNICFDWYLLRRIWIILLWRNCHLTNKLWFAWIGLIRVLIWLKITIHTAKIEVRWNCGICNTFSLFLRLSTTLFFMNKVCQRVCLLNFLSVLSWWCKQKGVFLKLIECSPLFYIRVRGLQ